jgi:hypothetical protein
MSSNGYTFLLDVLAATTLRFARQVKQQTGDATPSIYICGAELPGEVTEGVRLRCVLKSLSLVKGSERVERGKGGGAHRLNYSSVLPSRSATSGKEGNKNGWKQSSGDSIYINTHRKTQKKQHGRNRTRRKRSKKNT